MIKPVPCDLCQQPADANGQHTAETVLCAACLLTAVHKDQHGTPPHATEGTVLQQSGQAGADTPTATEPMLGMDGKL